MIKYLFFDFDGTISDAHNVALKSLTRVFDEYSVKFKKSKLLKLMGARKEAIFGGVGINEREIENAAIKYYDYLEHEVLNTGIKPCVSLKPLKKLSKKYKLIVVSNADTSFVNLCIEKLKIKGLFEEVYGADKFKSKEVILRKLFKKYKIKPHQAMYIGDRFSDVDYARSTGCISVAIHNKCSWSNLSDVLKEKPDFIISDFEGLKKVVEGIGK